MSRPPLFVSLSLAFLLAAPLARAEDPNFRIYAPPVDMETADAALDRDGNELPPLPEGIEQLRFREIFELPVGPRGLEYSDRTRTLEGQRVRVLGFMVREDQPVRGRLLLAPFPFTLFTGEYGHAEDLPATVVHVHLTEDSNRFVPFTPGLLLLTGILETGNEEEPDGRVSTLRLRLDPPAPTASAATSPVTRNLPTT